MFLYILQQGRFASAAAATQAQPQMKKFKIYRYVSCAALKQRGRQNYIGLLIFI